MIITFPTLQALSDYVPSCIICGKEMNMSLYTVLQSVRGQNNRRWSSGREAVNFNLKLQDGILHSNHKSLKLAIDPIANKIVEGQETIDRLSAEFTYVRKSCPTCDLKIEANCMSHEIKKEKRFPDLTLLKETLHLTMKGGKDLRIVKHYNYTIPAGQSQDDLAQIYIDHKQLPPVPFEFNKFNSLEQLSRRIGTIILFH